MIFVTVGTHEQAFNRLLEYIDNLKRDGILNEEVIMQTGFSTYEPKYCTWEKLLPYEKMTEYNQQARIVISHGGPASFIAPLRENKIPIVVPRRKEFDEHINDHQYEFAVQVAKRNHNIIVVNNIGDLKNIILNYESIVSKMTDGLASNNEKFCMEFENIVKELMGQ